MGWLGVCFDIIFQLVVGSKFNVQLPMGHSTLKGEHFFARKQFISRLAEPLLIAGLIWTNVTETISKHGAVSICRFGNIDMLPDGMNMRKIHSIFCCMSLDRPFLVFANMFVSSSIYIICTNQSALPIHKNHHLTYHDTVIYLIIHNYLNILNTAFFDILLHPPAQMGFSRHVSRCEKDSAVAIPRLVAKCGAKDTTTPQRSGVPNGQSDLWHDFAAGCELCKYVV